MDKAALLRPHLAEVDVTLPDGGVVRVRALSRAEVFAFQALHAQGDANLLDSRMLAAAMVDPELTEEEVGQWRAGAPNGEVDAVSDAILEVSGLKEGAARQASATFPAGPGPAL